MNLLIIKAALISFYIKNASNDNAERKRCRSEG